MDRPEAADLVGRTSARLLALGIGRTERLEALHLLGVLDASTDAMGRVRRPIDDLAAEFELPLLDVLRWLDHLEATGAVDRTGGVLRLVDRADGGIGGLQLSDFLDDVRDVLDERPLHRSDRWRVRGAAALVAAAAVFLVLNVTPPRTGTPTPTAAGRAPSSAPETPSADAAERVVTTPGVTDRPLLPSPGGVGASGTTVARPDATLLAAACPAGEPILRIIDSVLLISNPTEHDLLITDVSAGGIPIELPELLVTAGETVEEDTLTPVEDVTIDEWEWADPDLARECEG